MKAILKNDGEETTLSFSDIFDILSSKIDPENPRVEFELINSRLYDSLMGANIITPILKKNMIMNIFYISFSLGYYYRLFLEKNNIEIVKEEDGKDNTVN